MVYGVPKDGPGAGQAKMLINAEVVRRLGEKFRDPGNFLGVFRQVCLHKGIGMLLPQFPGGLQLSRRRGRGETRRDGVDAAIDLVPLPDQGLRLLIPAFGRIAEFLRGVSIHQHLSAGHPQVTFRRRFEKRINGTGMHGGINAGRGNAVP